MIRLVSVKIKKTLSVTYQFSINISPFTIFNKVATYMDISTTSQLLLKLILLN